MKYDSQRLVFNKKSLLQYRLVGESKYHNK